MAYVCVCVFVCVYSLSSSRAHTFDALFALYTGFASEPDQAFRLKEAEIKHGRLAMVALLGFAVQAGFTGSTSPLSNLGFLN